MNQYVRLYSQCHSNHIHCLWTNMSDCTHSVTVTMFADFPRYGTYFVYAHCPPLFRNTLAWHDMVNCIYFPRILLLILRENLGSSLFFSMFWWDPCCRYFFDFLAHLDKGNVSFCHHLASVVRRLSSVNFSHFNLLLWNLSAKWIETW